MANAWDFTTIWVELPNGYPVLLYYSPTNGIAVNGVSVCKYLAAGFARKMISSLSGLTQLEGEMVSIVQDGLVSVDSGQVVSNSGVITLSVPAAVVHVGLPYIGTLKLLPLGGDGQTVNEGKKRKPYDFILRVWKSLAGLFGQDSNNTFPINYSESVNQNTDDDILFTGDIHYAPTESSWDDYCQPELLIGEPLPFMILAAIIQSDIEEK